MFVHKKIWGWNKNFGGTVPECPPPWLRAWRGVHVGWGKFDVVQ